MKAPHPITCAAPLALLLLGAACQAPSTSLSGGASLDPVGADGVAQASQPVESTGNGAPGALVSAAPSAPAAQKDATTGERTGPPSKAKAAEGKDKPAKKAKPKKSEVESLTEQLRTAKEAKVQAERELRYAEADLEIAEMGAAGAEIDAVESLRSARVDLDAAKEALEVFSSIEQALAVQKAAMSVSDAEERLITAQTDLVGLEDIFAEETEASAKPEILRRGRRKVERAQRGLELATEEQRLKTSTELPAKLRGLSSKVRAMEAALASATNGAAKKRRSADLSVEKATDTADDKKREARKAAGKVKSLEKRLNDARQKAQGGKKKAPGKASEKK